MDEYFSVLWFVIYNNDHNQQVNLFRFRLFWLALRFFMNNICVGKDFDSEYTLF